MSVIKKRMGQVLAPDFILGIIIFTGILLLCYTTWNISYEKSIRFQNIEDMQSKAFYISNILLNTPGIPQDWNTTNVRMIGLKKKDSDILDTDKIMSLKMMRYNESKSLFGLGLYGYYINITDPDNRPMKLEGVVTGYAAVFARDANDNVIKQLLQDYYSEWDYYWAGITAIPPNNATVAYDRFDASLPTQHHLFKMMMANMSSYDTIIVEAENTFIPDPADEAALKTFVSEGGILIDIRDKGSAGVVKTIGHFPNVHLATNADAFDKIGTIVKRDILFPEKQVGETITFESQSFRFNISEVDKAIVESDGHPGYCTVCLWYYGSGKIYFLPDGSDNAGDPIGGLDLDGIELTFGDGNTMESDNLVSITRFIMIENNQEIRSGIMDLYIYSNRTI